MIVPPPRNDSLSGLETHDVPDDIDPNAWALRVTGAVSRPIRLVQEDLAEFSNVTITEDFECAEGWIAKGLSWRGARVAPVLNRAYPTVEEGYVLVHAMDGDYACAFPRDRVANALLAFWFTDDHLPVEHGGPVRLVPTDGGSDCWESVKWVTELEDRDSDPVTGDTAEEIATARLE